MKHRSVAWLGIIAVLLGVAAQLLGVAAHGAESPSPLERIEGEIRGQAGQGNDPLAPSGPPAAIPRANPGLSPPEKSGQGPYLGAIADDRNDRGRGVRITEVRPGGPADLAGLRTQDLVVGAGGTPVRQMADLTAILDVLSPGEKVELDILRGGRAGKVQVTLGRRAMPGAAATEILPPPPKDPLPGPPAESPLPEPPSGPVLNPKVSPGASDSSRLDQLYRRIEQLERRVEELERAMAEGRRKS